MAFQEYYSAQSLLTDPGIFKNGLDELPENIETIVKIIQGLVLLDIDAEVSGYFIPEERLKETELRYVEKMLGKIFQFDDSPIKKERKISHKLIGNCRDFATLLCAFLRHKKIPARIRYGFYKRKYFYVEHAITEYWKQNENRWCFVDPCRTELNRKRFRIAYNIFDLPEGIYFTAGEAWEKFRNKKVSADAFGVGALYDLRGWWLIRNKLVHDFLALNKNEILPWDMWGFMKKTEISDFINIDKHMKFFDQLAVITTQKNEDIEYLNNFYENNSLLRVPENIEEETKKNEELNFFKKRWKTELFLSATKT